MKHDLNVVSQSIGTNIQFVDSDLNLYNFEHYILYWILTIITIQIK